MASEPNLCWETGQPLPEGMKDTAHFVTDAARVSWNNRQKSRGAQILTLLWLWRFERGMVKHIRVISRICALLSEWRAEDRRAGRRSYADAAEALAKISSVDTSA